MRYLATSKEGSEEANLSLTVMGMLYFTTTNHQPNRLEKAVRSLVKALTINVTLIEES